MPSSRLGMRYFKLTIAYDGTDFHGWQIQAGKPTIQGEIVEVLRRLTEEHVVLHGTGRTDAGVPLGCTCAPHRNRKAPPRRCRTLAPRWRARQINRNIHSGRKMQSSEYHLRHGTDSVGAGKIKGENQ